MTSSHYVHSLRSDAWSPLKPALSLSQSIQLGMIADDGTGGEMETQHDAGEI